MNRKTSLILLKIKPSLFWHTDGSPKRCTDCFHAEFVETVTDRINGVACESYLNCKKCGGFAQEWGYGYFNMNNLEPPPWHYIWNELFRKQKEPNT